jgi:DNA-binding NarL/FixJ family response regulator
MRILLVNNQSMFSDLLAKACRSYSEFAHIVAVPCITRARTLMRKHRWNVMILNMQSPDGNGFDFAEEVLHIDPELKIVGISADNSEYSVSRIRSSQLHAFVDINLQNIHDLFKALRAVEAGEKYYSPSMEAPMRKLDTSPTSFTKRLSSREVGVLCKIGMGLSYARIGEDRGIAPETVKWHCKQLMRRLGLKNLAELIVFANRKGFANLSLSQCSPEQCSHCRPITDYRPYGLTMAQTVSSFTRGNEMMATFGLVCSFLERLNGFE